MVFLLHILKNAGIPISIVPFTITSFGMAIMHSPFDINIQPVI